MPMAGTSKKEIRAHGVRVLLSSHPEVRKLKRLHPTSFHGNKPWASSWLLMDYIKRLGLKGGTRVMEVGCGWGLAGIYCAKMYAAAVTGVDIDAEVFPYLHLHAGVNKVKIDTIHNGFDDLKGKHLWDTDVLIGADVCFWDTMVAPLKSLIRRALRARVRLLLIADPGRSPFDEVADYFAERLRGEILEWTTSRPRRIQGRILKIGEG
jgi:predicted nicotinamide N-methyase